MRTLVGAQRANAAAAEIGVWPKVEITDPDGTWRDVSTSLGPDTLNSASLRESIDSNALAFTLNLLRDAVAAFQMLSNPDFEAGSLTGYGVYDNNTTGLVTLTTEVFASRWNRTGYRMKVVAAAGAAPAPGIGGFYRAIVEDGGTYQRNKYHKGDTIIWRMVADIPVGSNIAFQSNAFGTGGTITPLTAMAGTGAPFEYIWKQVIGTTGTFSSTGFWNIDAGTRPFTWYVYSVTATSEAAPLSLAPMMTSSAVNRNAAGAYAPVVELHRKWRVNVAVLLAGAFPVAADYEEMGNGFIDTIEMGETNDVALAGRDAAAILLDGYIRTKRLYGGPGVSMESVIQSIINDNAADNGYLPSTSGGITLYTPVATGIVIDPPYWQDEGNLKQALDRVAAEFAFVVRYRYDAADVNRLTLYLPNRAPTAGDVVFTLGPTEYLNIPLNRLDKTGIRNYLLGRYWDSASSSVQQVISPTSGTSSSITKYGLRFMQQDFSARTLVNTAARAQAAIDAMRLDMEDPALEQVIESYGLWFAQLGDYIKTLANGKHYDTDQFGAVSDITHTIAQGTMRSRLGLRGKPAGRYRTWQADATTSGGPLVCPAITLSEKVVGGPPRLTLYRLLITFVPPASADFDRMEFEVKSDTAGDVSATALTATESPAAVNVQPDVTYTVKPFVISKTGERTAGTQQVLHISATLHVGPTRLVLPVGTDLWAT